jgi:hypothetical protein
MRDAIGEVTRFAKKRESLADRKLQLSSQPRASIEFLADRYDRPPPVDVAARLQP